MQRREETQSRQDGDPVKPTMDTGGLMEAATGSSRRTLSSSRSRPQRSQPLSSCQSSGPWKDGRNLCWCSCGQENSPHQPTCFFCFFLDILINFNFQLQPTSPPSAPSPGSLASASLPFRHRQSSSWSSCCVFCDLGLRGIFQQLFLSGGSVGILSKTMHKLKQNATIGKSIYPTDSQT